MTRSLPAAMGVLAASTVLAMSAAAAPDGGSQDPDYLLYRCAVLGDPTSCPSPPSPPASRPGRLLPGPYATKLIVANGVPPDQAIAAARGIGEEPRSMAPARSRPRDLTSHEKYEQWMGRLPREMRTPPRAQAGLR